MFVASKRKASVVSLKYLIFQILLPVPLKKYIKLVQHCLGKGGKSSVTLSCTSKLFHYCAFMCGLKGIFLTQSVKRWVDSKVSQMKLCRWNGMELYPHLCCTLLFPLKCCLWGSNMLWKNPRNDVFRSGSKLVKIPPGLVPPLSYGEKFHVMASVVSK